MGAETGAGALAGPGDRMGLTSRILIGMLGGLLVGSLINLIGTDGVIGEIVVGGLFHVTGSIFLASLKLLVVPVVFVSLVCGTAALDDIGKLGRVGGKTRCRRWRCCSPGRASPSTPASPSSRWSRGRSPRP